MGRGHILRKQAAERVAKERRRIDVSLSRVREQYTEEEWKIFDGDYYKMEYFVRLYNKLANTVEIVKCYPNAGFMMSGDGTGREWYWGDRVEVALCKGADQGCFDDKRLVAARSAEESRRRLEKES